MNRLQDKVAVVYGDGAVGAAIAKVFAREGAKVFLTGRTVAKLEAIAGEIRSLNYRWRVFHFRSLHIPSLIS